MDVIDIKKMVRDRDGCRCTICGLTSADHFAIYGRDLDVHRIVPGSPYEADGCVTVCRSCHGPLPKSPRGTSGRPKVAVDDDQYQALKERAAADDRSVSAYLRRLLARVLTNGEQTEAE